MPESRGEMENGRGRWKRRRCSGVSAAGQGTRARRAYQEVGVLRRQKRQKRPGSSRGLRIYHQVRLSTQAPFPLDHEQMVLESKCRIEQHITDIRHDIDVTGINDYFDFTRGYNFPLFCIACCPEFYTFCGILLPN